MSAICNLEKVFCTYLPAGARPRPLSEADGTILLAHAAKLVADLYMSDPERIIVQIWVLRGNFYIFKAAGLMRSNALCTPPRPKLLSNEMKLVWEYMVNLRVAFCLHWSTGQRQVLMRYHTRGLLGDIVKWVEPTGEFLLDLYTRRPHL